MNTHFAYFSGRLMGGRSRHRSLFLSRFLILVGAGLLAGFAPQAQSATDDAFRKVAQWQFGQSREPLVQIEDQIRQTAPGDYAGIEARLLPLLQSPDTPKDAKRYLCRWLSVVGSEACVPALAALLADPDLSHLARFALEPMANAAAGAALREALPRLSGNLRVGVVGSIGVRRDGQAVPALGRLAASEDPVLAETALRALGEIGTPDAAAALQAAKVPASLERVLARAKITAAGHLAAEGHRGQAAAMYRTLMEAGQPALRAAALKGLIAALEGTEAVRLVVETLQSDDPVLRDATISAFIGSGNLELKNAVARELPGLPAAGQIVLMAVLADDPNVAAREPVLGVFERREDLQVRVAAIRCLARHGQAADVPLLVRFARSPTASLAEAARETLQRMSDPGVDQALVKLIESPEAADRAVVLATLASRRVESALPTLARLATGADATLATEAVKALGVMGQAGQLPALGQVLVRTEQAGLREAAEAAAAAICRRSSDKGAAAGALVSALQKATTPRARISILPVLVITGGDAALAAVNAEVRSGDATVRDAAVRALVAWPDASAAPHLVSLAKTTDNPTHAILALRDGCLRLAAMEETSLGKRLELYRGVLELAKRVEERKQAVAGLAQLPSLGALELLQSCARDAALKTDAALAITRLARQLGAVYQPQALAALESVQGGADEEIRKQVEQAIKAVRNAGQSPDGFIVAWLLAGPYQQQGKGGLELFDVAFPPETGAQADWRPVSAPASGRAGLVEMDKIFGGNDRVAYLRTQITAEQAVEALLEMGSDDGIKAWLNGKVVHANNVTRPNTANQDKARVQLQAGVNTLLLKITQGGGEWSACCRLRAADGKELDGVMVAPPAE